MAMTTEDRRFTSTLLIVFGPLFVAGGYLAAFTLDGALFVFAGLAMLLTGVLLRTRLPMTVTILVGAVVFGTLVANLAREL